ncbi:class I SAM-dependent methyltransferase [Saccharothrix longispora]|uniref:class I SAM-dependent methyltransferase n=1 Tax=Saccharothrix longispora TaxID=33920 RepID=UPI0028FD04D1|nr:class I SAM-dependent methyltransferase [Saccharothrix longispora]MBY8849694.1 class I SAM-dependent methyltransferase [Saccharothrix sp. MB29]MDU0287671.1 class I SAM-dependent methyltransferase [Saccharothrix longispora]
MHEVVNTHQAEAWNGYEGRHWAEHQARYDEVNSGFNEVLLDAAGIGPHDRVLDIGCGNGQVTRLAAARGAGAVGIDLSAPMLARARLSAVAEDVDDVVFEQGDAQVHPFPAGAFDVALSRFGVMFFADPVAAFGNVARALRPGGRLAFLAMRDLGDLGDVVAALGWDPAPGHGPLSMADPDDVDRVLRAAGFRDVRAAAAEAPQVWGRDVADATAFLMGWGPVRHALRDADAAAAERVERAVAESLRSHAGPGGVRLRGSAWLVTARV